MARVTLPMQRFGKSSGRVCLPVLTTTALAMTLLGVALAVGCGAAGSRQEMAQDWVNRNQDSLEDQVVSVIIGADFGYKFGNELVKKAIRDDVVRQVRGNLDWSFEPSSVDEAKITATASMEEEIQTEAMSSMSGLIRAPALEGTIAVSQPFELTIVGESISYPMFPAGGSVILDIRTR